MASPFLSEIRMFGGNFAPRGYAFCQGQLLSIAQNTALFALIGTIYGGNGQTTFAMPDYRGRVPVGQGTGPGLSLRTQGEQAGTETVTLLATQIPAHTHTVACNIGGGNSSTPAGSFFAANANTGQPQFAAAPNAAMSPASVSPNAAAQPHSNLMPYLGINFIIALQGVFPSRN